MQKGALHLQSAEASRVHGEVAISTEPQSILQRLGGRHPGSPKLGCQPACKDILRYSGAGVRPEPGDAVCICGMRKE